jgi:hypothetical protein
MAVEAERITGILLLQTTFQAESGIIITALVAILPILTPILLQPQLLQQ